MCLLSSSISQQSLHVRVYLIQPCPVPVEEIVPCRQLHQKTIISMREFFAFYSVLNAHMDSLQWIDQATMEVQHRLDETARDNNIHRKESERNSVV
jgi:hypothetical protein